MNANASRFSRLNTLLASDPKNFRLLAECADLALAQGLLTEARTLIERALAEAPSDPHLRAREAHVLIAQREYDAAIEILADLIASGTDAPALRYNLGFALMHAGRYAEAKEHLAKVPEAEVAGASLLLARAHHYAGETDEAVGVAEGYAAGHPEDGEASGLLAMLYLDKSDLARASDWARRSLASPNPAHEAHTVAAFLSLGKEEAEQAEAGFDKALALKPKSGRAWSGKGLVAHPVAGCGRNRQRRSRGGAGETAPSVECTV